MPRQSKADLGDSSKESPDDLLLPSAAGRVIGYSTSMIRVWTDTGRLRLTPRHYAYLRISEGCDQKCTFCTIPSIRGPMHCKTPEQVLAEARELIADGAVELNLIGQDTTSYGRDIGYKPGLAGLLGELNKLDGVRWIRLLYVYPSVFTDAMIDAGRPMAPPAATNMYKPTTA